VEVKTLQALKKKCMSAFPLVSFFAFPHGHPSDHPSYPVLLPQMRRPPEL
jgi:hypothetical protein